MRALRTTAVLGTLALLGAWLAGCGETAFGPDADAGPSTVTVRMGAASAGASVLAAAVGETAAGRVPEDAVDAVRLAIHRVEVHRSGTNGTSSTSTDDGAGWTSLEVQTGGEGDSVVVDLVALTSASSTASGTSTSSTVTVAEDQLEAGDYSNVRLFFEWAEIVLNSAVTLGGGQGQGQGQGGQTFEAGAHDLVIPSAEQTGLKVPTAEFTVDQDGAAVDVLADTDASIQNINVTGRGLMMTPVLTSEVDEDGADEGDGEEEGEENEDDDDGEEDGGDGS